MIPTMFTLIGPGVRNWHKGIGRKRYMPNGKRECARRVRQMQAKEARS